MKKAEALDLYSSLVRFSGFTRLMRSYFVTFPLHKAMFAKARNPLELGVRALSRQAAGEFFIEFGEALKK